MIAWIEANYVPRSLLDEQLTKVNEILARWEAQNGKQPTTWDNQDAE
jgi:hypothetical protein